MSIPRGNGHGDIGIRRHVHLDAVGGVAGDMFVAAMLDALPDLEARVRADLAAVLPVAAGQIDITRGTSGGLAVRRFAVVSQPDRDDHPHGHTHDHHHDHGHSQEPEDGARPSAPVRYDDIVALIRAAALAPGSAEEALGILRRLGEAESRVHGVPLSAVHFHEIADWGFACRRHRRRLDYRRAWRIDLERV